MSIYTNLVDKVESDGLTDAPIRFSKDNAEFFAFISDISETIKAMPSIVDDLSEMGFDITVVTRGGTAVSRYFNHLDSCCGDGLDGVWSILRNAKRYKYFEKHIRAWHTSFIKTMYPEIRGHVSRIPSRADRVSNEDKAAKVDSNEGNDGIKITLDDYKNRQLRCYTNKLRHGFNVTDFQKEARFILKELSELMDAIEHNDVENLIEELGDIVIFCYGIAEMAHKDLDTQVFKKMEINESRVYHRNEHGDFVREDK